MTKWIISRSESKQPGFWHIQARTADQFCSFAVLATDKAPLSRGKSADGKHDVFTLMSDSEHGTMNVLGDIRYEGTWPKK